MWPYGRAVRAYAPDEALGYLSLRCGQNVEILHKDEDGWLFGSKASTEGVLEGKQHGWFPEELLLAPPPLQTPPQPSQDASSPADKALRVDEPEVVPEFTETLHPELTEKMSAFAPEDAPSLQIVTLGLEVAQIMCMDYNSLAQGLHEHHEALGSPLGPNAAPALIFVWTLDASGIRDVALSGATLGSILRSFAGWLALIASHPGYKMHGCYTVRLEEGNAQETRSSSSLSSSAEVGVIVQLPQPPF
eukprot:CAMPEP_0197640846 /NCGR_PEP_ID=MMETSP1338-20131121/14985_1 /TAXON_ID=43686 ORGANISM="Pelagodinium beii, Strain RCC1491" /NCGR_SAMPLE_ID=MMETSP1338 /ASSEMBLY_ACC=CAM_ASM_000754 /LENGTH=246 /DNA_ID=CAMNT_0043213727 /DNA_START=35 /DNA_END=776 /DNA_ORIENTATION=-